MYTEFNNLKYNLYELLNVKKNASLDEISSSFRRIIKKFHPDKQKLSKVEEELFYEITTAYHILSNEKNRYMYNQFLDLKNHNNNRQVNNTNNYQTIIDEVKNYFPESKEEAVKDYLKKSEKLYQRHGAEDISDEKLSQLVKNKNKERDNIESIQREDFKSQDEFNNKFTQRKVDGNYSDKIVEYNGGQIMPFELGKSSLSLTQLKDFNNMYTHDSVREKNMTSLSQAFLLQPHVEIDEDFNYNEKINNRDDNYNTYNKYNNNFKNEDFFNSI
jgi:curved DNA-binding protein CbpA